MTRSSLRSFSWAGFALVAAFIGCGGSDSGTPSQPPPPTASIIVSSDSIDASLVFGGAAATQEIDVTSSLSVTVPNLTVVDVATGAPPSLPWVSATLSSQTLPAKVVVTFAPGAMPIGTYSATLRLSAPNVTGRTVRLSLTIRPRPRLVLTTTDIALSADAGTSTASQEVGITSVNGAIGSLVVSLATCNGTQRWLTPSLKSTTAPSGVVLSFDSAVLSVGTHVCSFDVSSTQPLVDSATESVRVSLTIRGVPRIGFAPDTVQLGAVSGSGPVTTQVIIVNLGAQTLTGLSLGTIDYLGGPTGWLTPSLQSATAPTSATLTANAEGLGAGTYAATVQVSSTAPGVGNSPAKFVVRFVVTAAPIPPPPPNRLETTPAAISLTTRFGSGERRNIDFTVRHTGTAAMKRMSFNILASSAGAFEWWFPNMTCADPFGAFQTPCTGYIEIRSAGMPIGTHSGFVIIGSQETGTEVSLPITLTIVP